MLQRTGHRVFLSWWTPSSLKTMYYQTVTASGFSFPSLGQTRIWSTNRIKLCIQSKLRFFLSNICQYLKLNSPGVQSDFISMLDPSSKTLLFSLYSTHESLFTITSFRAGLLLFQQSGTYDILFTIKFCLFFLNWFVHKQKHVWYLVSL